MPQTRGDLLQLHWKWMGFVHADLEEQVNGLLPSSSLYISLIALIYTKLFGLLSDVDFILKWRPHVFFLSTFWQRWKENMLFFMSFIPVFSTLGNIAWKHKAHPDLMNTVGADKQRGESVWTHLFWFLSAVCAHHVCVWPVCVFLQQPTDELPPKRNDLPSPLLWPSCAEGINPSGSLKQGTIRVCRESWACMSDGGMWFISIQCNSDKQLRRTGQQPFHTVPLWDYQAGR